MNKRISAVIVALLLGNFGFSQDDFRQLTFNRITEEDGLSNRHVTAIHQDKRGFIWIGTEDGLNRYDGYGFTIFRPDTAVSDGFQHAWIRCIHEDQQQQLWVSTAQSGLFLYNRKEEKFSYAPGFPEDAMVEEMVEDDEGTLWLAGGYRGHAIVASYDTSTRLWNIRPIISSIDPAMGILPDRDGYYWVPVRDNGFYRWNSRDGSVSENLKQQLGIPFVDKMVADATGTIWMGTTFGLYSMDRTRKIQYHGETAEGKKNGLNKYIFNLYKCEEHLWVATEGGGLTLINLANKAMTNHRHDRLVAKSIPEDFVWAVYEDNAHRVWGGTYASGVFVYDPMMERFPKFDPGGNLDKVSQFMIDSRGRMWWSNTDVLMMKDERGLHEFVAGKSPGSISSTNILKIFEDSRGRIWFGTWNGGLARYEENTQSFIMYGVAGGRGRMRDINIQTITEDPVTGSFILGTWRDLEVLSDLELGTLKNLMDSKEEPNNRIQCIMIRG
ncbi:MAG: hypothetical protein K1X47_10255, partial [Cyclobacteriaceae bacterium]|nr:hypothetical protein [Cyclobacteriaceae bacterium]